MSLAGTGAAPWPVRRDLFTTSIVATFVVFFAVRPTVDALATFEIGPDLNSLIGAVLLASTGLWTLRLAAEPDFRVPIAGIAAVSLAFVAVVSALGAPDLGFSASMALRVVVSALMFVACEQLAARVPSIADLITGAMVIGLGLTSIVAIGQLQGFMALPESVSLDQSRIPGPFPAPTVFATCMFIAVAVIVGLAPIWWNRMPNLLWLLGPAVVGFTYLLLANGSRSPLGALVLAVSIAAISQGRKIVLVPVVAAAAGVAAFAPSLISRSMEVFDTSEEATRFGAEVNTLVFRVRYWERNLPHFDESPFIGIGLGRVEQINAEGFPPHNTSLQAMIEMGSIGLVAHYVLVIALAVSLVGGLRRTTSLRVRAYLGCALGISVGYLAMSFFENLLTQVVTTAPVAAFVGLALGLERNERLAVERAGVE